VAGSGVQDICPMKPRFRKANLLVTHVLDQCVKLLAVLHISSAHQHSGERQEKRTKTPYSLHIHLITTHLNIAADRHVLNMLR